MNPFEPRWNRTNKSAAAFALLSLILSSSLPFVSGSAQTRVQPGRRTPVQHTASADDPKTKRGQKQDSKTDDKPATLEGIREKMLYSNSADRKNAIRKIHTLKTAEQETLHPLLINIVKNDMDATVREAAIITLGELKVRSGEEALIFSLSDEKRDILLASVSALGRIESTKGCKPMADMLEKQEFKGMNPLVLATLRVLGDLNYKMDIKFLKDKSADPKTDIDTRGAIMTYFGAAGIAEASDSLFSTLKNEDEDPNLRAHAATALSRLGGHEAVKALRDVMEKMRSIKNPKEKARVSRLRFHVLSALIRLGDKSVEPEILAAAKDDDANVRFRAIKQIGELRLASARELLEFKSKFDESRKVKKAAKQALDRLEGRVDPAKSGEEEDADEKEK
ncbi:MAG: HEAT repeat domain-containing protein [Spirochaetia bacterium]|nr:HEAT repeat domain-containing protein [Spirochaetia bacterium]